MPTSHPSTEHLAERRLGLWGLVFMIVAASAPMTFLAGGVPTAFAVTEIVGVPLTYLVLGIILAFFAVGYGTMSTQIQNAGAFYAYITAGLGVRQGIGAAILALVSYNAMQVGLYGIFGFALSSLLEVKFGLAIPWWGAALIFWAVVGLLGILRIDLSAKVITVLVLLEFLVVVVADAVGLAKAPEGISMAPLSPAAMITPGFGAALAFGIAGFMGFESGAIYGEEVKNPETTVRKATYVAVALIALFYAVSAWAFANGVGVSQIVGQSQENGPDLLFIFLGQYLPAVFVDIANVLFISSLLAALMAFHNASARYFFALGRPGVLPAFFAHTNPRTGAPIGGSLAQSVLGFVVILAFGFAGRNSELGPLYPVITLFTWLTNAAAFGLVFLMCVTSIAVFGYFRKRPGGYPASVRVVAPLVAAIGLGFVFVMILANFGILIGAEGSSALVFGMPAIILGSGLLGLLRGEYLRRKEPQKFDSAAHDLDQIP